MNRLLIVLLFAILVSSCEKNQDNNENILKFYGDALEDIGYSIAKTDNGYVIAGQFTKVKRLGENYIDDKNSLPQMGIIKTDLNGNIIWQYSYGGRLRTSGSKVIVLDDGSVVCAGYAIDSVTLQKDIYLVKTDASGSAVVEKQYKSIGNQYANDIIKTQEGFILLGTTDVEREPFNESTGNAAGKKDILIQRIDNDLSTVLTSEVRGYTGNDEGKVIKPDRDGGYIVAGTTDRSDQPLEGQSGSNIILVKINGNGSSAEPRIIVGPNDEFASDIEVLNDGYLIAGTVGTESEDQRGYLVKLTQDIYDPPVFANKFEISTSGNTSKAFSINAICCYKSSSVVMVGKSGIGSSTKMLILVTDIYGTPAEGKQIINSGTGLQMANDVISDDSNNIIVVGKNSYDKNTMITFFKFRF